MKTSQNSNASNPVEIARARLVTAENLVADAKQERRATKHRRKQAEMAARRAKKDLRRAREELQEARSALTSAETNYADELKAAIRAKKRSVPKVVRPIVARKKAKRKPVREQIGLTERTTPGQAAVPVETAGGDSQISSTISSPIEPVTTAQSADQVTQEAGSA